MEKIIRLSKSSISNSDINNVVKVLKKEYLGMGDEVAKFEHLLKKFFKRDVVCVANGTAALQLSLEAIGLKKNDQILVPSITFLSTFQSVKAAHGTPIPCDVEIDNMSIDLIDAEKKITSKTKAIIPVHYAGNTGNLDKVYKFAKKYKIRVIEDAAHAFGSKYKNKKIGSFGDIVCFSFDGIKNITSGEGGCVVTKDKKVLNNIKISRVLGIKKNIKNNLKFEVHKQGWRYHMSNIMAAIGISQWKRSKILFRKRQFLAKKYDKLLKNNKDIILFKRDYNKIVPHIYPIRVKNLKKKDKLIKLFLEYGIQIGVHYYPNHKLSFFKIKKYLNLNNTNSVLPELITLPLHTDLKIKDINYICKILILLIKKMKKNEF